MSTTENMEEVQETQDFHHQDEGNLIIVKYKGTNNQKMKKKRNLKGEGVSLHYVHRWMNGLITCVSYYVIRFVLFCSVFHDFSRIFLFPWK